MAQSLKNNEGKSEIKLDGFCRKEIRTNKRVGRKTARQWTGNGRMRARTSEALEKREGRGSDPRSISSRDVLEVRGSRGGEG